MAKLTLYGTPISTYVRAVRLLLEAAGANYNLKDIGIFNGDNRTPEYLAKNPFGKVPTLEVDGAVLYETAAITEYLDVVIADHKFSPSDPLMRARMRQMMAIIDSYLYAPAITTIVIQRLIVPNQGGQTDENVVNNAIAPVKKAVEAIESLMVGNSYLLGSEMTIADFYLIPIFIYLSRTPEFKPILSEAPKLQTWWNQAKDLQIVKKVCA